MTLAVFARAAPYDVGAPPFATVETYDDLVGAEPAWRELESSGGAYQTLEFALAWAQAFDAGTRVVVARDAASRPVALLPLQRRRFGPLRVADFLGGAWANYHMGLFRPGVVWREADVRALLQAAAAQAGVDLFAFSNQPSRWEGVDNPLALLPGRPSPSRAFASALPAAQDVWLDAHFSRATQKKLRKKVRKLEALGAVVHRRAAGREEAAHFLDAFLAQKAAHARQRGERDLFARVAVRDLLRRLIRFPAEHLDLRHGERREAIQPRRPAAPVGSLRFARDDERDANYSAGNGVTCGETPLMEMHGLLAGERVVATFGGLCIGRRLSGLIVSYDGAPEIAVASPGEWLLIEVARDAISRGLATFDLGVGESRYKRDICEIEEALQNSAFGVTPLGRFAAPAYLGGRAAMGWMKRRPQLLRHLQRLRQFFS